MYIVYPKRIYKKYFLRNIKYNISFTKTFIVNFCKNYLKSVTNFENVALIKYNNQGYDCMKIAELILKCKLHYASNPLVVMLFGGGASLRACFNNFFDYKLFFFLSKESEAFCARRTRRSFPNEGGLEWVLIKEI